MHGMRITALLCALAMVSGCTSDDEPGDPSLRVDFVSFLDSGTFRLLFVDTAFQAGEVAFDVIGESVPRAWRVGPWPDLVAATDDDVAPYPGTALPRKRTVHDGRLDKRYWSQFAGGSWRSLALDVDPLVLMRASSSPPPVFPAGAFMWCPTGRPCMTWQAAVFASEARCWLLDEQGQVSVANRLACLANHPRMHWRIVTCDDCPIPAVQVESDE
jgi:hypothetical protein